MGNLLAVSIIKLISSERTNLRFFYLSAVLCDEAGCCCCSFPADIFSASRANRGNRCHNFASCAKNFEVRDFNLRIRFHSSG